MKTFITVIALGLAGCASAHMPQAETARAKSEIKAARVVGAEQHTQAALHLQLATDQLEAARNAAEDGEQEQTNLLLERARVDAELARALAEKSKADEAASQALLELNALDEQKR